MLYLKMKMKITFLNSLLQLTICKSVTYRFIGEFLAYVELQQVNK
jgi:hypothetical protein